jgi:uncharacterized protein (TIGR02646 family)
VKYILKQNEPQEFTDWKSLANTNWQPSFENLSGTPKESIYESLITEQGCICCYCESNLSNKDFHIEHFRPQHDPSVDPLDYSNMLCSCQNQLKKGEPRHCGNLKDKWFDEKLLISPLDPSCEKHFLFLGNGLINPANNDNAAAETIKRLGLDCPKLNALRASVIEPFLDETLSLDEMKKIVADYLTKNSNGCYGEFWSAIRYLFGYILTS